MKIRYPGIMGAISACLYLAVIVSAIMRMSILSQGYEQLARQEFDHAVELISAATPLGFQADAFRDATRQIVLESRTLAALIVSGPHGPEYAAERSPGYLDLERDAPRFQRRYNTAGDTLFSPVLNGPVRNATISATYLKFSGPDLFLILRDSAILVLIAILLSLLSLLVLWVFPQASSMPQEKPMEEADEAPAVPSSASSREDSFEIPELSPDCVPVPNEAVDATELRIPKSPAQPAAILAVQGSQEPAGLYSPQSSIGWATYTKDRLSFELRRCASFEQDLVFMAIQPKDSNISWQDQYAAFAQAAVDFFTFRDMVFERDNKGISLILPNIDLEHGLKMCEEFISKIIKKDDKLGEAARAAELRAGLSSRSGRLIDTDRLMMEAMHALEKSLTGDAPIVAFKSDPERFRAFLANKA